MAVLADEERPGDSLALAIAADCLAGGQDVILVERAAKRGAAMPGCAEGHDLGWHVRVGVDVVVGVDQPADVDQHRSLRRLFPLAR